MRSFSAPFLVILILSLTLPLSLAARAANGPDAGMRQAIAVALPGGTAAAQAGEVSQSQHGGGEGARMDADCDSHPAPVG
jgi:hypothetical protein